jgi:uncharacterized protein (TIGR03382 family)
MARTLMLALAILLVSTRASAECDAGCDSMPACSSGVAGAGGCSSVAPMQPPDEDDPGGCSCLWSDELPGSIALSVALLPSLAWMRRRRRSNRNR